ncbi:MAG TPA: NUDIX hydrolase [Chloroflexota bacterium]|nr:NUDIX hydrolase [Chloroflexota bacterium]
MAKLKTSRAESAGGVVYRIRDGVLEVILVGRVEPETWGLPKGTPNKGETREETALRETREETGLRVRIVEPIDEITYWFVARQTRICKTVYYYLMVPIGGSIEEHDPEYDLVSWFPVERALALMTYTNEAEIVRAAARLIERRESPAGHSAQQSAQPDP